MFEELVYLPRCAKIVHLVMKKINQGLELGIIILEDIIYTNRDKLECIWEKSFRISIFVILGRLC